MPTYYVRNDGSDANTGLGPGRLQAWQTIQKALGAAGISSGDTVYIAPGRYNEFITVAMVSATVQTSILGDPTCTQFSDITPGVVRLTSTAADNAQVNYGGTALTATSKNFLTFRKLLFENWSIGFTATTCTNWTIDQCAFICFNQGGFNSSPSNVALNFIFTNNILIMRPANYNSVLSVQHSGTAAVESNTIIANNYFTGGGNANGSGNTAIYFAGYTPANALIFNNTFHGVHRCFEVSGVTDATLQAKFYNNYTQQCTYYYCTANIANAIYADYNRFSCSAGVYATASNTVTGTNNLIVNPTLSHGMERLFGLGVNDWYAPRLGSNLISSGTPNSISVGITAGSAEMPLGGNAYVVGDKIQFLTTLGNIVGLQTYTVATVTGTTSFTCTGLTPSTAGSIQHRRFILTTDAFGTAYPAGSAPTVGMANRVDLSTIGQYIPSERQTTTFRCNPGATSQTTYVFLGVTGISFNTPNLVAYYVRNNGATVTVPLVTQTPTGAWVSGGFCEVDSVRIPGLYRFDIPNALVAAGGVNASFVIKGASGTNGAYVTVEFDQATTLVSTPGYKLISDQLGANGELDIIQGTSTTVKLQIVDTYNTAVPIGAATCTVEVYSSGNLISTYTPTIQYESNGEMTFILDTVVTTTAGDYKVYVRRNNGGADTAIHGPMVLRVRRR